MDFDDKRYARGAVGVGAGSILVYLVAPPEGAWQGLAFLTPLVLAIALLLRRFLKTPGPVRRRLRLLLAGQLCYLAASLVWYVWPIGLGRVLPFPSIADGMFFVAYGFYAAFLLALLRRFGADSAIGSRIAVADSLILSAGLSAVLWVGVVEPALSVGAAAFPTVVAIGYPASTLLLFALTIRTTVTGGFVRTAPGVLIVMWMGCEMAGDIFYGFQSANGSFSYHGPVLLLWMASFTAVGILVTCPPVSTRSSGAAEADHVDHSEKLVVRAGRRNARLSALLCAALVPLALCALYPRDATGLLITAAATFCLLTYRTAVLAGDLDEQHRLAAELDQSAAHLRIQRDSLNRYAAMVDATDESVVATDRFGTITDWNPASEELYGYTQGEAIGRNITLLADPDDEPAQAQMVALLESQGRASVEIGRRRKDGTTVVVAMTLSTLLDHYGGVAAIVGISRDISEQKAREARINQESKLESLGRLSAGLAHEINSPIQFVGDNARFLEEAYRELIGAVEFYRGLMDTANPIDWAERQERVREAEASIDFDYLQKEIPSAVAQTLEGIDRVSTIVRAMKTFSHPGHHDQVYANLNEALEATVTVTRHQVNDVADLQLELADLPPVRCNVADLNQVFLNLIVNAADAIEETGQRGAIRVVTGVDGDHVEIQICDTGGGIPLAVLPKIFEPFFTTKDVGRGTGQGLPLARAVIHEGHGGVLSVQSVPGQGTTFTVRLPVAGRTERELATSGA